jgi:outer membrane protein OmpA-like peptidoglycan-associated protein
MKTILIGAATLALLSGTPAAAQVLGGGLGGRIGGLGGAVGGGLGGTLGAAPVLPDAATQAQDEARHAERIARRDAARQRKLDAQTAVAGSAGYSTNSTVAGHPLAVAGTAQAGATGRIDLDAPGVRTRGIEAATNRGLRRVARTASGVPVFVNAQTAAPRAALARPYVASYPAYDRSIYYGGGDAVFLSSGEVGGYVDREYYDLQRDMRGTGATVSRRGNDLVLELPADVTFAFDKADIQPRFVGTLNAVARALGTYRATDVEIIGHTDSIGSDQYNLALSERRGRSVADFLVDRAADPSRLVVEAMGKSEPIASNATIAGRAANRRVEIVFHPRMD